MGLAWSFFNPLLLLIVYTFVFSVVFKSRWSDAGDTDKTDFAIFLFVGMIVYGLFAECVNRAPGLILSNPNYVKKVIFPLEVLPWVPLGSALFHATVSLLVLLCAFLAIKLYIPWTVIFVPVVLIPLILVTMGLAWFLAATGVFVRDIGQTTVIMTMVLMFLSPVFYPVSSLPPQYRDVLMINPLGFVVEQARLVVIRGELPDWKTWLGFCAAGSGVAWGGFWWFQRNRKGFADVL